MNISPIFLKNYQHATILFRNKITCVMGKKKSICCTVLLYNTYLLGCEIFKFVYKL